MKYSGILTLLTTALLGSTLQAAPINWSEKNNFAIDAGTTYDLALSGNNVHVAYVSGGHVINASRSFAATTWSYQDLGVGAAPSIAGNTAGHFALSFINNDAVYVSADGAAPVNVAGGSRANLALAPNSTIHLLTQGGYGGNRSYDFGYLTQALGGAWSPLAVLASSYYDSGFGNYYQQSTISAKDTGYFFAFEQQNWGGRASWSDKSFNATNGTAAFAHGAGWNDGLEITANGLTSGALETAFVFTHNGNIYAATSNGTTWTPESLIATGSQASVDAEQQLAIAYVNSGNLMLYLDGLAANVLLDAQSLTGTNPIIRTSANANFLLYSDGGSTLSLLHDAANVPEPSALALLLLGSATFLRRRKH